MAVTERTVAELGLPRGATLPQIFEVAQLQGLLLRPVDTGPYSRLAANGQEESRDSLDVFGSDPTAASQWPPKSLSHDDEYPKGFYLRVVDGQAWLRGYRCDDEHAAVPRSPLHR